MDSEVRLNQEHLIWVALQIEAKQHLEILRYHRTQEVLASEELMVEVRNRIVTNNKSSDS